MLLDHQAPEPIQQAVRAAIEEVGDNRLYDLHIWSVAPGTYAAALGVVTHEPRSPDHYKALVPVELGIVHLTVEVQRCDEVPVREAA